jgi:hypothetical protein
VERGGVGDFDYREDSWGEVSACKGNSLQFLQYYLIPNNLSADCTLFIPHSMWRRASETSIIEEIPGVRFQLLWKEPSFPQYYLTPNNFSADCTLFIPLSMWRGASESSIIEEIPGVRSKPVRETVFNS